MAGQEKVGSVEWRKSGWSGSDSSGGGNCVLVAIVARAQKLNWDRDDRDGGTTGHLSVPPSGQSGTCFDRPVGTVPVGPGASVKPR